MRSERSVIKLNNPYKVKIYKTGESQSILLVTSFSSNSLISVNKTGRINLHYVQLTTNKLVHTNIKFPGYYIHCKQGTTFPVHFLGQ